MKNKKLSIEEQIRKLQVSIEKHGDADHSKRKKIAYLKTKGAFNGNRD